jgi:hypothetical protein
MGKMNKYEKEFNPLGLRVPDKIKAKDLLKFGSRIEHPEKLLLDGYATAVENQGDKPYCAAYSASNFAESVLWRKKGYRVNIDPIPLYVHAKKIDGDPLGDGTYLECTLDALLEKKYFDRSVCKVKTLGSSRYGFGNSLTEVKNAIHRYGVCIAGFQITGEWFNPKGAVIRGDGSTPQGGHAVTLVGYDRDGVLVLNSWGKEYARDGFVYVTNKAFDQQFMYGAVLTRCLDDLN